MQRLRRDDTLLSNTGSSSSNINDATTLYPTDLLTKLNIDKDNLHILALQRPTPLVLADMYKYASTENPQQRLWNAQFLHKELPIRIAQRAVDLMTLPHGLNEATTIRKVTEMYLIYLQKLLTIPKPTDVDQEMAFTALLQTFVLDRSTVPMSIARGVAAWQKARGDTSNQNQRDQEIEDALYRFFTARVGLRFLTEHHVLSSNYQESTVALRRVTSMFPNDSDQDYRGCIQTNCDLAKETKRVADLISEQTKQFYGMCPSIDIVNCLSEKNLQFTYVPHHLHYMLAELLKNSCRSTVHQYLRHQAAGATTGCGDNATTAAVLYPIRVVIVKGDEDVTLKIADKGGGIQRSSMSRIWKFGATNDAEFVHFDNPDSGDYNFDEVSGARLRGFGLPLARIYARYFGGELSLKSMEGYGVDAYLHLPRLGNSYCENLPMRVKHSPGERDSMPQKRSSRQFSTLSLTTGGTSRDTIFR
jgi:pyruvate dehydrogenase kinase 2/3/4